MNIDQILKKIKKFIPRSLFSFFQPAYHFFISFFAAALYGFPSRRLIVLGVTGTKGKTTVIELTREILKEAGAQVASLSSVRFQIGEKEEPNMRKMTMPGRFFVQKFLYDAVRAGCKYAVLEVTSEGVKQFRHRFIRFRAAAATNVAPEHLESHGNFEKYLRAKLDLFWRLPPDGSAIINQDDPAAERFAAATTARRITYGKDGIEISGKTLAARDILINGEGTAFEINGTAFSSKLLGEFNLYNIFCAVALGLSQHTALGKIARAVARVNLIPGRMEFIPAFVKTSAGEQ
ncbi:MAG: hypothetical protein HYW91_01615, partial [Candidatus Sungbacteria bacterium]|nr:hypothetical protein [Candidatus Sungbacteria bacterium]